MTDVQTRIASLQLARDCAVLGACRSTIFLLTGLAPNFILRAVFGPALRPPRGRPTYTEDFYFRSTAFVQSEVSAVAVKYKSLLDFGLQPHESLLSAFRHYLSNTRHPSFTFDEAFFLISQLDGRWACTDPTLQLTRCPRCGTCHIAPLGSLPTSVCPLCRLETGHHAPSLGRHASHRRRGRQPHPIRPAKGGDGLPLYIQHLRTRSDLEGLGAHKRVIDALLSDQFTPFVTSQPQKPTRLVTVNRPLSTCNWSDNVKPLERTQYGILASHYRRQLRAGVPALESLTSSYRHLLEVAPHAPITFDRAFEVVSLLDARWGVREPVLDLVPCHKCGAEHLVSRLERGRPRCPVCALLRFPSLFRFGEEHTDPPAPSPSA